MKELNVEFNNGKAMNMQEREGFDEEYKLLVKLSQKEEINQDMFVSYLMD